MKPRSAAAAFILSALASTDRSALYAHAQDFKQKSHKPLTAKQQARIDAVFDHYLDAIKHTLATTPFEGDTAEVDGVDTTATVTSEPNNSAANSYGDTAAQTEAPGSTADIEHDLQVSGPIVLAGLLGGLDRRPRDLPGLTINVTIGDVHIGADALAA
jgi:hypothetical protein